MPDIFAFLRHNIATATEITAHGSVWHSKLRIGLRRQPGGEQDNVVALPRPGPVSLQESGLVESGAFRPSLTSITRVDELFAFPTNAPIGSIPVETFFYRIGAWRRFGSSGTTNDAKVFIPGSGVFLRLDPAADSVIWINSPNY